MRIPVSIFHTQLDFRSRYDLLDIESTGVPEVNGQVVTTGSQHLLFCNVFCSDDGSFMGIHFTNEVTVLTIIHFVLVVVFFQSNYELVEVEHTFYLVIMFLPVDDVFGRIIVFDDVMESTVFAQEA